VTYLGLDTIKSLVLSIEAFSQFEKAEAGGLNIESVWNHSTHVAALAKRISGLSGQDSRGGDEAFTAGLLHDVGKLVLAVNFPCEYIEATRLAHSGLELPLAEHQVFSANHADVGGYLIGLWGLPAPVVEAVALHHWPSRAAQKTMSTLTSVHVANVLECERGNSTNGAPAAQFDHRYLDPLGVSSCLPAWREALQET
jgi:HD-like signal output (HDOD) protein